MDVGPGYPDCYIFDSAFQELLLSVPNFLGNLLTYACDRRSKMVKTASWFEFLDDVVNREMRRTEVSESAGNFTEDLTGAVFERAQALYMISLFLTGSTR